MQTKWQCSKCGASQTTANGLRPSVGGFCGKSSDHKHKWVKAASGPVKWQCRECGVTQMTSNGLKPSVGSFCGKAKDHKHKWSKV
jgi:predicted nucleic-acid-binding Zn-ribbon protein